MEIEKLKKLLIEETKRMFEGKARFSDDIDPSHDIGHALRVLNNAEYIAKYEGGDLEIIIPAALFHDYVVYSKYHPKSEKAPAESADMTGLILRMDIPKYPKDKIPQVKTAIIEHSYSNGLKPSSLESQIIQDADRLEATGAISIMRTFSSCGQMKKAFYNPENPFCADKNPYRFDYALDLFYRRLLVVGEKMNTNTAKILARERTQFLYQFLDQLKKELYQNGT